MKKKSEGYENPYGYNMITLYFDKNNIEHMKIYRFLQSSRKFKTKFIIYLINEFLEKRGILDVDNLSQEQKKHLIKYCMEENEPENSVKNLQEVFSMFQQLYGMADTNSVKMLLNNNLKSETGKKTVGQDDLKRKSKNVQKEEKAIENAAALPKETIRFQRNNKVDDETFETIDKAMVESASMQVQSSSEETDDDEVLVVDGWKNGLDAFLN